MAKTSEEEEKDQFGKGHSGTLVSSRSWRFLRVIFLRLPVLWQWHCLGRSGCTVAFLPGFVLVFFLIEKSVVLKIHWHCNIQVDTLVCDVGNGLEMQNCSISMYRVLF